MSELEINPALCTRILAAFIADEVLKVGAHGVVVGVSGGIDSALSFALAVKALGRSASLGVAMPYRQSSPESLADAQLLAAHLEVELMVVDISPQVDAYFATQPTDDRNRRGNKMARERMSVLYDLSQERTALVLGTSNKSELLLGYGTLYGDMASALNPLGDLYKTQVYQLAEYLGLPSSLIRKAPSADLFEGQMDEQDLGFSYAQADRVLFHLVDQRCPEEEVVAMGFPAELVRTVRDRVRRNQFKRRPPLIAKLSSRTIDLDFRYPRDWGH
ncbi:MAG TPA: NAD+ synthase [Candidatus Nanopelagicaceae bacterium]|nr:NAD+ synthase [Candidatus Nanopelagicaceae bacterium]